MLRDVIERRRAWILRARLRALAYVAAITTGAVATITIIGAPWLPVVGVVVAALAVTVSKVAKGLDHPTCLTCGEDLRDQPVGVYGIACPKCGAVTTPLSRDERPLV